MRFLPRFAGPSGGLAIAVLLTLLACTDPTGAVGRHGRLEVLHAPPSVGLPGARLLDTLRVQLMDPAGRPLAGQPLTWTLLSGGGSIAVLDPVTEADGLSRAVWTLGPAVGLNELAVRFRDTTVTWQTYGEAFRVDRVESSYNAGCGLRHGDLWCWTGIWRSPPVSDGPPHFSGYTFDAPGLVAKGQGFVDLAVAPGRVCALTSAGGVQCFAGAPGDPIIPAVPPLRRLAGSGHSLYCGLTVADSTAWCWDLYAHTSAPVPGSPPFLELSIEAAPLTACGLRPDSTAACWGTAPLGNGTTLSSPTPVPVGNGLTFAEITAGLGFACGRRSNGDVWCWGSNTYGAALGGPGPDALAPVLVTTGVSQMTAGNYTVAAIQGGRVVRWGQFRNSIDNPPTPLASVAGLPVAGFSPAHYSCLRLVDGQVYCIGKLWVSGSVLDIDDYLPVKPVPPAHD